VQAVVNELHGERIDIIEWTENPASFVVNALAPAEVERVLVDEESNVIEVAVGEDNLAIAIGRKGQNVRLAADLTGWDIEIMTTGEEQQKRGEELEAAKAMFVEQLEVSEAFSIILVEDGFISLEDIAYSNVADLASLEGMDEAKASALQNQARNRLLGDALQEVDERTGEAQPLSALPQMRDDLAEELRNKGIETLDDLAEVSVDELEDVETLAQEEAKALIIAAREACGWFDES
jgi:N utilization substance protein A